jgi:hypothetical protein
MFDHLDDVRIEYFYGKENYISAVTTNTIESSQFTLQAVKDYDPDVQSVLIQLLILGGMNNNEMDFYLERPKPNIITHSHDLFCKNEFAEFVATVEPKS